MVGTTRFTADSSISSIAIVPLWGFSVDSPDVISIQSQRSLPTRFFDWFGLNDEITGTSYHSILDERRRNRLPNIRSGSNSLSYRSNNRCFKSRFIYTICIFPILSR